MGTYMKNNAFPTFSRTPSIFSRKLFFPNKNYGINHTLLTLSYCTAKIIISATCCQDGRPCITCGVAMWGGHLTKQTSFNNKLKSTVPKNYQQINIFLHIVFITKRKHTEANTFAKLRHVCCHPDTDSLPTCLGLWCLLTSPVQWLTF